MNIWEINPEQSHKFILNKTFISKVGFSLLKRSIFEPWSQWSIPKQDPKSSNRENVRKLSNMCTLQIWPDLGSFLMISRSDELWSFLGLLRWDRGSNVLLLSTKKLTFQKFSNLTYKGPSGGRTPPGEAIPPFSGIYSSFRSSL